ncbi:cardiolipin synthase [Cognatishimia sp. F0-27]|uniref:cardiolipin synthase n=1 Tax=Cognatishimia sp. F0-27 TaxID=2816855 RepID=UPI001D0CA3BF|nr:cardiolipin synthase [Cognatishimia sp. F0-27]MCC1493674.1 cardiolipin synthase [Cognatishimia sp. F0-27]
MQTAIIVALIFVLQVAAAWAALSAVRTARTPQGAVGWVVFILSAPYVGVILYLFLGQHRYRGFVIARRESDSMQAELRALGAQHPPACVPAIDPLPFERLADLSVVGGNRLRPLIDGEATFKAIFEAIDAAQHSIVSQFFIVHDDEIGRAFRDRLVAAAQRGVVVRFMTDAVGSKSLPKSFIATLEEAGVRVAGPGARRLSNRLHINFRNHRKTIVVDGIIGFTGGLNVGDEYMGRDPNFGHWRDTHLEITGPVVTQLQLVFAEDWHWFTREDLRTALNWRSGDSPDGIAALVVPTGPADAMETGGLFFLAAIAAARERIWIASPYCVPDVDVLSALKLAALSGRDVRLLVPDMIDHTIPWLAAFAYFDELRAAGVTIWRYKAGFMHQKVVLIDTHAAAIGTSNLDNRSFRLNFETMVIGFDPGFAAQVAAFLETDFGHATRLETPLSEQPLRVRYGAPVARLFAPIL